MTGRRFTAIIEGREGGGAGAPLPFDPKEAFGRARPPVRVTAGRGDPFRTTIAVYGGVGWIGLRKAQLAELGLAIGDPVDLTVEVDDQPRDVDVPAELPTALDADPEAAHLYETLSCTHRKEYALWVGEAKRAATRSDRASKALELLRAGRPTPR